MTLLQNPKGDKLEKKSRNWANDYVGSSHRKQRRQPKKFKEGKATKRNRVNMEGLWKEESDTQTIGILRKVKFDLELMDLGETVRRNRCC